MASAKERAWLSAHQKGSRALVQRLDKVHANNPEYQAFKKTHGLENTSSVKQVSKSTVDRAKEKARQTLAGKAYGATKGTRMGSAEGTGETLRDTIAPLTRDQHSAVKAAEREAKAAEKPAKPAAAPKTPAKPKKEKAAKPAPEKKKPSALELIAAAAAKRKINQPPVSAKALRRIAAVGDMEHDHGGFEDLGDTQYGSRGSYNEEVELKVGQHVKFKEPVSGTARHTRKPMSFDGGKVVQVTPTHAIVRPQAWHGDEGLDVHVPHKNIKETIVEGDNYGKPYNNDEDLKSKSNKELQSLHNFWKTRIEKNPNHSRAKDQLAKIKAILAGKIGKKIREEVENFKVGDKVSIHAPDDLDWHERKGELISTSDGGHVVKLNDGTKLSATKHQIKKIDESHAAETLGYMLGNFNSDHSTRLKHIAIAPTSHLKYLLKNNMGSRVVNRTNDNGQPVTHPMIKHIKKELAKRNVQKEEVELDENDYSRRRKKEEEIISGKKPERKRIPMGSDYAARRRKERLANNGRMDEANYIATADSNPDMLAASRYGTTTTQAPKGTEKDYQKLLKRQIKNRMGLHKKPNLPEEAEQVDEMIPYALSAANYQAELRRQEKAKTEHQKTVKRKAKEQLDKDSEDTGNPFANYKESAPGWMLRQNPELAKKVKARITIAKNRKKQMGNPEPVKEAKKHHMGGALFADTAARLQKAVNAHKERMNQIENGPEDTYHHAGLNLTTKSRVKLPAPWAKVEDK